MTGRRLSLSLLAGVLTAATVAVVWPDLAASVLRFLGFWALVATIAAAVWVVVAQLLRAQAATRSRRRHPSAAGFDQHTDQVLRMVRDEDDKAS